MEDVEQKESTVSNKAEDTTSVKIRIDDTSIANQVFNLEYFDTRIMKLEGELDSDISSSKALRYFFIVVLIFCILGYFDYISLNIYLNYIFTIFSGFCIIMSFTTSKQKNIQRGIDLLKKQKSMVISEPERYRQSQYFDSLVGINIRNLEEYYELVKTSNKNSFITCLVMSVVGICLLVGGLVVGFFVKELQNISYLISASGIVIELITALLFYLYNKTVIQLKEYHDSLLDVQNILLSFKLIDDIKDEGHRLELMKQMMGIFIQRRK